MTIKGLYYNLVTRQTNTVENDDDDDDEEEDDDDSQKTQNVAKVTQEFHNISLEHRDSTPEMGKVLSVYWPCFSFSLLKKHIFRLQRNRKRKSKKNRAL